jgi:uncharacterized membrane protein YebE (DUF533 family)
MDAIDILGGLFGRKRGSSEGGPDLGDVFGRRPPRRGTPPETSSDPRDVDSQAKELEELLHIGREREAQRQSQPAPQPKVPSQPAPAPRSAPADGGIPGDSPFSKSRRGTSRQNDQALALVRAMINAAKADGQISSAEQQSILQHFDGAAGDAMQFLRSELSQPLNVREFAWSVPVGMEQKVYAMSLIAIDVDTGAERSYLNELAHALRLPEEITQQLEDRFSRRSR